MSDRLTDEQLDALEQVALLATQGTNLVRWPKGPNGEEQGGRLAVWYAASRDLVADFYTIADREHYVQWRPENVHALIKDLRDARAQIEQQQAELDAARRLHDAVGNYDPFDEYSSEDEKEQLLQAMIRAWEAYDAARAGEEGE